MLAWETWEKEFLARERDWERTARVAQQESVGVNFWKGVRNGLLLSAAFYAVCAIVVLVVSKIKTG